jgi:hypothetical protein
MPEIECHIVHNPKGTTLKPMKLGKWKCPAVLALWWIGWIRFNAENN